MMERTNDRIQILLLAKIFEPLLRNSPHEDGDREDRDTFVTHKIISTTKKQYLLNEHL